MRSRRATGAERSFPYRLAELAKSLEQHPCRSATPDPSASERNGDTLSTRKALDLEGCATPIGVRDASLLDRRTPPRFRVQLQVELRSSSKRCAAGLHLPGEHIRDSASNRGGRRSPVGLRHRASV